MGDRFLLIAIPSIGGALERLNAGGRYLAALPGRSSVSRLDTRCRVYLPQNRSVPSNGFRCLPPGLRDICVLEPR
jgi:hypothetical protein